jgi:hypothetical protein
MMMREVEYVCEQCGEKDHVRLFEHEPVPPAINCWSCHSGMKLDMAASIQTRRGMFPVIPDDTTPEPAQDQAISA